MTTRFFEAFHRFATAAIRERSFASDCDIDAVLATGYNCRNILGGVEIATKTMTNYLSNLIGIELDALMAGHAWTKLKTCPTERVNGAKP